MTHDPDSSYLATGIVLPAAVSECWWRDAQHRAVGHSGYAVIRSMLTEELKDYLFALVDSGHHAECPCHDCETLALICAVLKARIFLIANSRSGDQATR